jgi:creatinine amidohydrolase
MRMIRLEEITWVEFDQLERDKTVVWIPISPIEAHGPHLPLGTDLFGARDMAEAAADLLIEKDASLQAVVAPAIPLGGCRVTADFPGTLSMRGSTLARVVIEVCEALAGHGFRYFVIANHHLDPVHMKAILGAIDLQPDRPHGTALFPRQVHPDLLHQSILPRNLEAIPAAGGRKPIKLEITEIVADRFL